MKYRDFKLWLTSLEDIKYFEKPESILFVTIHAENLEVRKFGQKLIVINIKL